MTDLEYLRETLRRSSRLLTLGEIQTRLPEVPQDNLKEALEWLAEQGKVQIHRGAAPLFPRCFSYRAA